jgi:hypothetical protein
MNTNIKDSTGRFIFSGDTVHVSWLEDIGLKELDLDATGTVRYMSDGVTAAFFVEFHAPIDIGVCEEGRYCCARQMLIQATEDYCITFTVVPPKVQAVRRAEGASETSAELDAKGGE